MSKARLEAFSDGVIAIIITIMVLEMRAPHSADLSALSPLLPVFGSYVLSFVHLGIYWNNHHHMLHAVKHVNGAILWSNLHLLFWLSLVPFVTAWMGENHFERWPVALWGCVMLMSGVAYYILTRALVRHHGPDSALHAAVGRDVKGLLSVLIYTAAILLTLVNRWVSITLYVVVALIWLVPDRRIERRLSTS